MVEAIFYGIAKLCSDEQAIEETSSGKVFRALAGR